MVLADRPKGDIPASRDNGAVDPASLPNQRLDRGLEPAKRRDRRRQRDDQEKQWQKNPGYCWPSPRRDDMKRK